jgi:hypothetical protein
MLGLTAYCLDLLGSLLFGQVLNTQLSGGRVEVVSQVDVLQWRQVA